MPAGTDSDNYRNAADVHLLPVRQGYPGFYIALLLELPDTRPAQGSGKTDLHRRFGRWQQRILLQ